jgi:hypothetical protein
VSNELIVNDQHGATCYPVVLGPTGQVWSVAGSTFGTLSSGSWANYAVSASEIGSTGIFMASFPTGITTPGKYTILYYEQQGGSPAVGDILIENGSRILYWSGSAEVPPGSFPSAAAIGTAVLGTTQEGVYTLQGVIQLITAALIGEVSDAESLSPVFKGLDGSTTRFTITVDAYGDRTDLTIGTA